MSDDQDLEKTSYKSAANKLYPHLLELLLRDYKLTPATAAQPQPHTSLKKSVWVPELDYLVYLAVQQERLLQARYKVDGTIRVDPTPYKGVLRPLGMRVLTHTQGRMHKPDIMGGYDPTSAALYEASEAIEYVFPMPVLRHYIDRMYTTSFLNDFRISGAKTRYMKGVVDLTRPPQNNNLHPTYTRSCSTYSILSTHTLTPEIINNTRAEWGAMEDTAHARSDYARILHKEEMLKILDAAENQKARFDYACANPEEALGLRLDEHLVPSTFSWHITETRSGDGAPKGKNIFKLPLSHPWRELPRKVQWRQNGSSQELGWEMQNYEDPVLEEVMD